MKHPFLTKIFAVGSALLASSVLRADADAGPRAAAHLVIPASFPALVGQPLSLHLNDALLNGPAEGETLEVRCDLGGRQEDGVWTLTPGEEQLGEHPWILRWKNAKGEILGEASSVIRVFSDRAGAEGKVTLLLVGDSLTDMTLYPNALADFLRKPGNPGWTMLGLNRPKKAGEGVSHEGYGGWTWERFNTRYFPNKPPGNKLGSSPFLFAEGSSQKPLLDVSRYLEERCGGQRPDVVIFFLGINDCFHADPEDAAAIDERIDGMMAQAEILLAAFRKALPEAEFGICLTPTPNIREAAFRANYQGAFTRKGWRRIQYRLVERQLADFGGRDDEGVHIIPLSLVVDSRTGYPSGNAVHPNAEGFQSIGATVYAWLKGRLANSDSATRP